MITNISIENFKGIRDRVELTFKPITLLFGANSAGKSTIVQALHYAREVLRNHNLDADRTTAGGEAVRLSGFRQFIHNHDLRRPLVLKIGFQFSRLSTSLTTTKNPSMNGATNRRSSTCRRDGRGRADHSLVQPVGRAFCDGVPAGIGWRLRRHHRVQPGTQGGADHGLEPGTPVVPDPWERRGRVGRLRRLATRQQPPDRPRRRKRRAAENRSAPIVRRGLLGQPTARDDAEQKRHEGVFSKIFLAPLECLIWDLGRFRFVGAMRALPPSGWQDAEENDANWADGAAAWRQLLTCDEAFVDKINEWLAGADKLDAGYRVRRRNGCALDQASPLWLALASGRAFDEVEDLEQQLKDLPTATSIALVDQGRGGLEVAPYDVGIGVTQLVPILVACLDRVAGTDLARTVAIDTPELHLHPMQVAALGDMFVDAVLGENPHGVILETHSEHLILRILRRIRQTHRGQPHNNVEVRPEHVAAIYVESGEGHTTAFEIGIGDDGEFLQPWPDKFFDQDYEERYG